VRGGQYFLFSVAVISCCINSSPAFCRDFSRSNIGTTAGQFLKIEIGARAAAMGGAYTSTADDTSAIYWNPAGLSKVFSKEISAMYAVWFQNISYSWAGYSQKLDAGTIGASISYLGVGEMQRFDNTGRSIEETYTAYDFLIAMSYALKFRQCWPIGASFKIITSNLEDETASALALDLGALKEIKKGFEVGFAVKNIGSSMKYINEDFPLPLIFSAGAFYKFLEDKLITAADMNFPIDNDVNLNIGAEYLYLYKELGVSPRLGFRTARVRDLSTLAGFSSGIGFFYKTISFDYAWAPYRELGSTHRFSLSYSFE